MARYTIDASLCTRDRICIAECPMGIIELREGAPTPSFVEGREGWCIACGHFVTVCPRGAFGIEGMAPADCPPVLPERALSAEQAEYFLRSRRSIRAYRDKDVDRGTLEQLLGLARYAPTGSNRQAVRWSMVCSRGRMHELGGIVVALLRELVAQGHPAATRYPLEGVIRAWDAGIDTITRGAPVLAAAHGPTGDHNAAIDCIGAMTYLDLAAPSLGLGACWTGFVFSTIAESAALRELLAVPDDHTCHGAMLVGYPRFRYRRLPTRHEALVDWIE